MGKRVEPALSYQRGRGIRVGDVAEHLGGGVEGAEAVDCVDSGGGGRSTYACGGGTDDAVGISYGADFDVVILSDAVFHGGEQPLSVFEQRCALIGGEKKI